MVKSRKWLILVIIEILILFALIVSFVLLVLSSNQKPEDKKLGYNIPESNALVEYKDTEKLIADLSEKTGKIRYFIIARPTCVWCYQYMPYINEYAMENNIEIWYFNPEQYKGATVDKDGNYSYDYIEYERVVKFVRSTEGAFENGFIRYNSVQSLEDPNVFAKVPWLFVPSLYKVVDGTILEKLQTIPGHEKVDGVLPPMTEVQKEVLTTNIEKFFKGE